MDEKPIALDWKSCLEMQKAAKQAGVKTVVSFCLHWNPSLMNTRRLIDAGAVGTPYYVEVGPAKAKDLVEFFEEGVEKPTSPGNTV